MAYYNDGPLTNSKLLDAELELKDAGLVAASGITQVGGVDRVLQFSTGRTIGEVVIDVSAIEVASGDEQYEIITQFSTSEDFSDIVSGPSLGLGADIANIRTSDSTTGRYALYINNIINNNRYEFMRLYTKVSGTVATGINYSAFLTKLDI